MPLMAGTSSVSAASMATLSKSLYLLLRDTLERPGGEAQ